MAKELFFNDQIAFREWLDRNHSLKDELWVCYYKKHTGKPSIDWEQSVEEALCYGWIDGIRKKIDEESYKIRFTPRRKNSIWSRKNIKTVERLIKEKRMQPAGFEAFKLRTPEKSQTYSYEQRVSVLSDDFEQRLRKDAGAWEFFQKLSPSIKKMSIQWVMSAKREVTRQKRFDQLIESCSEGLLVPSLRWTKKN